MRTVVCDIEANGLDPDTIWIIVAKDLHTGEQFIFDTHKQIHTDFPKFADTVSTWIGHYFLRYDVPVLNKLVKDVNITWE